MYNLINVKSLRTTAVCAAVLALLLVSGVSAAKVQVPEDTKISVKFPSSMKISGGEMVEGIPVGFELTQPIEIGGKVIVDKGAKGTAIVKEVVKAGGGGKPGSITVEFQDLVPNGSFKTLDDTPIKLKGEVTGKGKGKGFFPYLFFKFILKGGQGEIPTNQIYTASVAESVILEEK